MAQIIGKDTYLEEQKNDHSIYGLFFIYIYFIAVISYGIFLIEFHFLQPEANIIGVIVLLIYLVMREPINEEIMLRWDYIYGLRGEESVQKILEGLPKSYIVVANVVLPDKQSNIDFVVIGPSGIFAIEVKSHAGRISYDGQQLLRYGRKFEKDFLWQTNSEASELYNYFKYLNIEIPLVEPILVFSSRFASVRFGRKLIDGISVIGARWLLERIQANVNKISLSVDQIDKIQKALESVSK